jgi:hypothetical protein
MRTRVIITVSGALAIVREALILSHPLSAQQPTAEVEPRQVVPPTVQPIPTWHSPCRFAPGDSRGSARSSGRLPEGPRRVALTIPSAKKAARIGITQGPARELAHDDLAVLQWTANPGGSDDHFGCSTCNRKGRDPCSENFCPERLSRWQPHSRVTLQSHRILRRPYRPFLYAVKTLIP